MKSSYLLILLPLLVLSCSKKPESSWSVSSPDGNIIMNVFLKEANGTGNLFYEVSYSGDDSIKAIKPSHLGIERNDQSFNNALKFVEESAVKEIRENYEMITGKRLHCKNDTNEKEITFENDKGAKLKVVLRAYNDGVAFRYVFPENDTAQYTITNELTGFHVPIGKTWMQPYEKPAEWGPAYETAYVNGILTGTTAQAEDAGWSFPALFDAGSSWVLVTEANIEGSFYGAHLQPQATDNVYTIALPGVSEAGGHYAATPQHALPWATPWRVIILGKSLGKIVESTLVSALSEPSKVKDINWIKPGHSSWSWWSDHTSPRDYKKIIPFIDFGAEMGWEYSLIDANWNMMQNGNIQQLIGYAKSKNVGLFLWYNSGGVHTEITEQPRDIISDPVKRKAEFEKLHAWGVKGVKVDFFNSDKPYMMQYYQDILKDAADNELMVLFHGCTLPRGWERTYPNLMGMEGVRGAEQYWDTIFADNAQTHHTILACTRNVVGSMDYTPVTFTDSEVPHLTTYAHELSLAVIFESGVTHFADRVSGYKNLPTEALEFLKRVPTAWDDTKFLQGYPGKEMVLARRKGDNWFIAGINGEKTPKEIVVDLSFIEGDFNSVLVKDGETSKTFDIVKSIDVKKPLTVNVLGRGGFIIEFIK